MQSDNRLIVALDMDDVNRFKHVVSLLGETVSHYKVGMELFYSVGEYAVEHLRDLGKDVFLDLKLHDIPNTVARSTAALTKMGASMMDLHASGGKSMMEAAVKAADEAAVKSNITRPKMIAITVLTSLNEQEWQGLGFGTSIEDQAATLAYLAREAGMDGIVASGKEAPAIRKMCGSDFLIITPGIRPSDSPLNDQSRVCTPKSALQGGADYLVVGRPITEAADPREMAKKILWEMNSNE